MAIAAILVALTHTGLSAADDSGPVFELRTYTTNTGKLPNLHARFADHTLGLFKKHGIVCEKAGRPYRKIFAFTLGRTQKPSFLA